MLPPMTFRKLFVLSAFAVACSGSPTNFAGSYTMTVKSNANTCGFQNWTDGSTTAGIAATFTQDGTNAQLNVQGLIGTYLALVVGTSSFQGTVSGNAFTSEFLGTKTATQGACSYTINVGVAATLDSNNVLSGTLTYTPATNADASCGVLNSCNNTQTVSGTRTGP
jgi:hypothetical protein